VNGCGPTGLVNLEEFILNTHPLEPDAHVIRPPHTSEGTSG